jgi:hypothetical protein
MDIKTNIPGLYRSEQGYLINKDNDGLAAYKKQKAAARKMAEIETELKSIKNDVTEIKQLIRELVK